MKTRGIRNNNPLNIRKGSNWKGLSSVQSDSSFCQFESPIYGVRAALCLLRTYKYKYNLCTIREIISRFAPSSDGNDVERYCYLVRMNMIQFMNEVISSSPESFLSKGLSYCVSDLQNEKDDFIVNRWLKTDTPMVPMFYFVRAMSIVESNFVISRTLFYQAVALL